MAYDSGALSRLREAKSADHLLRAMLLYAAVGSFRTAAALAKASGLMNITPEGLFYRMKIAETFLENVLLSLTDPVTAPVGFRIYVVDATVLTGPGSKGTDWRIHVGYDPVRGLPSSVYVSDAHVGESLSHHPLAPGHLALGDRAYGTARNVHFAREAGADVLVRVTHGNMRLYAQPSQAMNWDDFAREVPVTGAVSWNVRMPVPPEDAGHGWNTANAIAWHDVRLVGVRNREGEVVWLLTSLTRGQMSDEEVCEVYRVRWQIELYFKRLKSIGDLDLVTSRDGPTAKAAILAKLILLVLAGLLCEEESAFSPYGYRIRKAVPT